MFCFLLVPRGALPSDQWEHEPESPVVVPGPDLHPRRHGRLANETSQVILRSQETRLKRTLPKEKKIIREYYHQFHRVRFLEKRRLKRLAFAFPSQKNKKIIWGHDLEDKIANAQTIGTPHLLGFRPREGKEAEASKCFLKKINWGLGDFVSCHEKKPFLRRWWSFYSSNYIIRYLSPLPTQKIWIPLL